MTPCGWEVVSCGECSALTNLDEAVREQVELWAVTRLWEWTNRRFGPCSTSVRPCRERCLGDMAGPALVNGHFVNLVCGSCGDSCSCNSVSEVILPGPISEPTQILIDGIELDLCAVRVDDWNRLVRIDGGRFPSCQDIGANPDAPGTWQVTYLKGEPVPPGGGLIAGMLACEYAKALCGDSSCRLPKRVSTITREGLTMGMIDNFSNLKDGWTGIWEIDDWISTYSTRLGVGPWKASTVSSPDVTKPRQTTWTCGES